MDFYEVLAKVIDILQREGRASYRALKRQFDLDDAYIEDLQEELIYSKQVARDEDGRVLVWIGEAGSASGPGSYWIPGSWNLRMSYTHDSPFPNPCQESNGAGQYQEVDR